MNEKKNDLQTLWSPILREHRTVGGGKKQEPGAPGGVATAAHGVRASTPLNGALNRD